MIRLFHSTVWAAVLSTVGAGVAYSATADIIAFSRLGERMLVVLVGGLSLWMGYRLFQSASRIMIPLKEGVNVSAEGNVEKARAGGFEGSVGTLLSVKMWDVGPGIFFALFGVGLLAYVLASPIEFKEVPSDGGSRTVATRFNFPGLTAEQSSDKATVLVRAIRTIDDYLKGSGSKDRAESAILNLLQSERFIIDLGFGEGAYNTYARLKRMTPAEIERETKEAREVYQKVNEALNGGV